LQALVEGLVARTGAGVVLTIGAVGVMLGAVATGTVTTDIPAATQLLAPCSYFSVGGTSSVIGMAVVSHYIEADC
jgi:hypothetical protein